MKIFNFKTKSGCRNLFILFLALILVFSFFAQLISTRAYKIDVSDVVIDVRGADLHMEVYKPAKVSSNDKLPCMIITHGGSESLAACSLAAWEFARRGFVFLNVSAYGAGLSDQPAVLEDGTGESNYNRGATMGMYDAYEYAKSIAYVDSTRIGAWAHSTGRHLFTKMVSYFGQNLTLNDRLLNVLYNDFGVTIAESQLLDDADVIAQSSLSAEDYVIYTVKKQEQEKIVSEYLKAARLTERAYGVKAKVAGFTVIRDPQMNLICGLGTHEANGNYYLGETEQYRKIFHTGTEAVQRNCWYATADYINDANAVSTNLGEYFSTTIDNSASLKNAIDNNNARFFLSPVTMHNGNLWSKGAVTTILEFYTQVLGYNNGDLSDSSTQPIDTKNMSVGYGTLAFTTLSMVAMIGMAVALGGWLLKTETFSSAALKPYEPKLVLKSKEFWLWVIAAVIAGFFGAWAASQSDPSFTWSNKTMTKWLPWEPGQVRSYFMLGQTAIIGAILFVILGFYYKKTKNNSLATLKDLNIGIGVKNVFKTLAIALIVFAACYISCSMVNTFFETRIMTVDVSWELMKSYSFGRMIRYALIFLPFTLVISALNNLCSIKGVSDAKDTFINVLVTSLGMILMMGIGFLLTYSTIDHAEVFHLNCVLSIISMVPMCNYLYRKMYKLSGSIWLGAAFVAILLGWRCAAYISHQFMWWGPGELGAFWGIY